MNYYILIIDTIDNSHTTLEELARRDGITLNWRGADDIDKLAIVGSVLSFDMNVPRTNKSDAVFLDLFTGDEQRYRVELRREGDDLLIWTGFLLPDSYSEPYTGGTYFVGFEATDGLGRIKGKYLADDFYKDEKSVIEIVSTCLKLTGLNLPIVFAPGVENRSEKHWENIFIDTSIFQNKDKKDDAHKILEYFVKDTVSCLYQHFAMWYFEGLNKHNLQSYDAKLYDHDGNFMQNWPVVKAVKNGDGRFTGAPLVTMMAPYNEIAVSYDAPEIKFPETVYQEENDGWIADDSITAEIFANEWFGHDNFFAKAKKPKYEIFLKLNNNPNFEPTKYISLNRKIYLKKGLKIKLILKFTADTSIFEHLKKNAIENGGRTNNFRYEIKLNDKILFSNTGNTVSTYENITFGNDDKVELGFEFITEENGLFDVVLFQPFGYISQTAMIGVFIDELIIEEIAFDKDGFVSDLINEEYTLDAEIELKFTDSSSGLGPVFLLGKLNQKNPNIYNTIDIPILYGRIFQGVYYAIVSLQGANLIADNFDTVYLNGAILPPLSVVYNLNDGEEMAVVTDQLYNAGQTFQVRQHKTIDYSLNREHWETWTDSVYQVEQKRYVNAVIGIYRRLFDVPKPKVDGTIKSPILFGDLITFNYIDQQNYCTVNTRINFDTGNSDVTMVRSAYAQSESANLPPFVDCGPDVYISEFQTEAFLNATAFDPDGSIDTYLWEKIDGPAGDVIVSPNTEDTGLTNLTADLYEYQLTVTDNQGLSASDTVRVIRAYDYEVTVTLDNYNEVIHEDDGDPNNIYYIIEKRWVFELTINPNLPDNSYINFNYLVKLTRRNYSTGNMPNPEMASIAIIKNGVRIISFSISMNESTLLEYSGVLNFTANDQIFVEVETSGFDPPNYTTPVATLTLQTGILNNTAGNIINLPVVIQSEF